MAEIARPAAAEIECAGLGAPDLPVDRQISSFYRKCVKPSREKYFSSVFRKTMIVLPRPAAAGGTYRDCHGRGQRDAMDVEVFSAGEPRVDEETFTDGQAVWSRHPDAGVKPLRDVSRSDGD